MIRMAVRLLITVALGGTAFADNAANAPAATTPPPHISEAPDSTAAPGEGFKPERYQTLWTKSPFAVETPEAAEESPDYSLVGVAQVDGIFYATLIQRQNSDHFVLTSETPLKGLSLTSITFGHGGTETVAALSKDGQPLTLKLEAAPLVVPPALPPGMVQPSLVQPGLPVPQPGAIQQNIQMPGANTGNGGPIRPLIRIHRSAIHLPPRAEQPAPPPAQAPATAPAPAPTTP